MMTGFFAGGCSTKSEKELFTEGMQRLEAENYPGTVTAFEQLVNDYPKGEYAPKAYIELGKIYQGNLIKDLKPDESFEKAIYYYRQVYKNFPDNPDAEKSMFMVGYIQANDLAQIDSTKSSYLDSAKVTYNEFLQKYPNGQLAKSAKAELDNLGVAAEEILKKNIEKSE